MIEDDEALCDILRRVSPSPAAIIIMSCVRDVATVAQRLGAVDHLRKPFDLASVTMLVTDAVQRATPET